MEKYYKRDYFLPVTTMLAAVSLQNLQFEGVKLDSMGGLKLYSRKGVWPPTFDRIYSLYRAYLEERSHFLKEVNGVLDVGTGSGVLSYILHKYLDKEQVIHAIDINPEAIKTVAMNSNILNLQHKINSVLLDFAEMAELPDKDCDKLLKKNGIPQSFELVVCNPPWINAKPVREDEFEIGNFDQDEKMIKALFKFCSKRLQVKSPHQKNGSLILVYSDLSSNLGLSPKHLVDELCMQYGLRIVGFGSLPFKISGDKPTPAATKEKEESTSPMKLREKQEDPLQPFKAVSSVSVYEITRV